MSPNGIDLSAKRLHFFMVRLAAPLGWFLLIALVRNILNLSRIDIFWQDFATGAIIIGAVLLDSPQMRVGQR